MCLLHIQASEKHINHFYGIEQKFIYVFQLRSARIHLNFRSGARKQRQFYSMHSNYSSCQHKSLLLQKQKCEASSGSHKNITSLFQKTTPSVLQALKSGTSESKLPSRIKRNENATHSREKLISSLALTRTKASTEFQKHLQIFCNSPTLCCREKSFCQCRQQEFSYQLQWKPELYPLLLSKPTNPKFSPLWFVFNDRGVSTLAVRQWAF